MIVHSKYIVLFIQRQSQKRRGLKKDKLRVSAGLHLFRYCSRYVEDKAALCPDSGDREQTCPGWSWGVRVLHAVATDLQSTFHLKKNKMNNRIIKPLPQVQIALFSISRCSLKLRLCHTCKFLALPRLVHHLPLCTLLLLWSSNEVPQTHKPGTQVKDA